jgi:ring-1,2-phenylacetyl-CoA epoxidase subunit PaaD
MVSGASLCDRALAAASRVVDPEIPVLTIADLGVLRAVRLDGDTVEIDITPTYSGCPAMHMIEFEIEAELRRAGIDKFRIATVLSPAWTTDWLSADGRRKLAVFGIAPPAGTASRRALFSVDAVSCPHCGSPQTERIAEFGSTSCKALYRCRSCAEPFDYFKCH